MDSTTNQEHIVRGFAPVVVGTSVRVERGSGVVLMARNDLSVRQGGGQWLMTAGHLDVRQGGGAALVARTARVDRGFVGALFAWHAELAPETRVLLRATPAVMIAGAAGFLAGCLVGSARRRSRRRRNAERDLHYTPRP
jgi:hypothetical protein